MRVKTLVPLVLVAGLAFSLATAQASRSQSLHYDDFSKDEARHWAKPNPSIPEPASDSILVLLKKGKTKPACRRLRGLTNALSSGSSTRGLFVLPASSNNSNKKKDSVIRDLIAECQDDIEAAIPDSLVYTNSRPVPGGSFSPGRRLQQASDPSLSQQWGLKAINVFPAWKAGYYGSPSAPVCVIDTGVQISHADLLKNLLRNPGEILSDGLDDDGNGYIDDILGARALQMNTLKRDGSCGDDQGHGTHVHGIIAALGNNTYGGSGVAPRTRLITCKALNATGSGFLSDIIACVDYCASRGARVINNSFGSGCSTVDYWMNFMANLYNSYSNILFVGAAGNLNTNLDASPNCGFPSTVAADNSMSVGAINTNYQRASFSSYGNAVDVAAPGVNIYSTYTGSTYNLLQGTSQATAFVSGAAAVLFGAIPTLTPLDIKDALSRTCNKAYSSGPSWNACNGFIDVWGALQYLLSRGK